MTLPGKFSKKLANKNASKVPKWCHLRFCPKLLDPPPPTRDLWQKFEVPPGFSTVCLFDMTTESTFQI
jgi:hypothetical protein